MAETSGPSQESGWVVPPPGPGGMSLFIAVAEDAQLTPELQAAIETLIQLTSDEASVQGFAQPPITPGSCPGVRPLTPTSCPILHACLIGGDVVQRSPRR